MRVLFRGNFGVDFSTESHLAAAFEHLGHEVVRNSEKDTPWSDVLAEAQTADLFVWTSTWDYAHRWPQEEAWAAVQELNSLIPTCAIHLDLFWGLARANQVIDEPWFYLTHVFTADGDPSRDWTGHGINHHWLPPAVHGPECVRGTFREEFASDVAFVGAWQGGYHPESRHRAEMLANLTGRYGERLCLWPVRGEPAIRGLHLNDLYGSAKVVVGDSCMTGLVANYWSDRVPETIGRGGVLVHPRIPGLADHYKEGVHFFPYNPFDWAGMFAAIDCLLDVPTLRDHIRTEGSAHVREHHTYACRVQDVLDTVMKVGWPV